MGEVTTFPFMADPPTLFSNYANDEVRKLWIDPDGASNRETQERSTCGEVQMAATVAEQNSVVYPPHIHLQTCHEMVESTKSLHSAILRSCSDESCIARLKTAVLIQRVQVLDLAIFGISRLARVAVLMHGGVDMASVLLGVMNRCFTIAAHFDIQNILVCNTMQLSSFLIAQVLCCTVEPSCTC